jgi:hypothetical protein
MLEVLIGLTIIFLVLSIFVAGIQEMIASLFQWRAKHLEKSILQMMTNQPMPGGQNPAAITLLSSLYQNNLVQSMNHYSDAWLPSLWRNLMGVGANLPFVPKFKTRSSHNNVNNAQGPQNGPVSQPSHLEPETFATALIQEILHQSPAAGSTSKEISQNTEPETEPSIASLNFDSIRSRITASRDAGKIPDSFEKTLLLLADRAESKSTTTTLKIHDFQKEIETMFDHSMQRATGVYKRNVQAICFLIGLLCSFLLNVNSVDLIGRLHRDNTLRAALVQSAPQMLQDKAGAQAPNKNDNQQIISRLKIENLEKELGADLPISPLFRYDSTAKDQTLSVNPEFTELCDMEELKKNPNQHPECGLPGFSKSTKPNVKKLALSIPGWLITAFAIYMGAPFWFEILGKLVQVRSIGKTAKRP